MWGNEYPLERVNDEFLLCSSFCFPVVTCRLRRAAVRIDSAEFDLPDGPFTIECWVNPSKSAGMRGLLAKTEVSEYAIFVDEGVPQFDVHLDGRYVSAKASDVLPLNQWTHVAGVFDGKTVQIYVNGKLRSTWIRTIRLIIC